MRQLTFTSLIIILSATGCSDDWGSDPSESVRPVKTAEISFYRNFNHIYGERVINDSLIVLHSNLTDSLSAASAVFDLGAAVESVAVNDSTLLPMSGSNLQHYGNLNTDVKENIINIKTRDGALIDTLPEEFAAVNIIQPSFMEKSSVFKPLIIRWEPSDFEDDKVYIAIEYFMEEYYDLGPKVSVFPGRYYGLPDDGYFRFEMEEGIAKFLKDQDFVFVRIKLERKGTISKIKNGVRYIYNLQSESTVDFQPVTD